MGSEAGFPMHLDIMAPETTEEHKFPNQRKLQPTAMAKRARKESTMNTNKNMNVRFTIDFINKTITGTKASFTKAGKGFGAEYEELSIKVAAHPDFSLVVKEQKHKSTKAKRTYDGLDFDFMEAYIEMQGDAQKLKNEYESVKQMAVNCGTSKYPMTKKWFLGKFGTEDQPFDMEQARKDIADFRIKQAEQAAA